MQVGANTGFSQIYSQLKPGLLTNESKHLRLDGARLYTHNPLMPHGRGADALAARDAKYAGAAQTIKNAIAQEHGQDVANRVFQSLNLGGEVKLSDLRRIRDAIPLQQQAVQAETLLAAARADPDAFLSSAVAAPHSPLAQELRAYCEDVAKVGESFDFMVAVHDYKATNNNQDRAVKGQHIYDTYIKARNYDEGLVFTQTAPEEDREINIPGYVRTPIDNAFAHGQPPPGPDVFDDANTFIKHMVDRQGTAGEFLRTKP